MDTVKVFVRVIPDVDAARMNLVIPYEPRAHGSRLSTVSKINVNKVSTGFTVVYTESEFGKLSAGQFVASLIKIFRANVSGMLDIETVYHYSNDHIDPYAFKVFSGVADVLIELNKFPETYEVTFAETELNSRVTGRFYEMYSMPVSEDMDDDEDDEDYSGDGDELDDAFTRLLYGDDSDDDDEDDRPSRSRRYDVPKSKVWNNANNPKRDIRRHGVIIADSKDDLKRDEKVIKDFLKEFIPGNADWKREFRNEVAKRWVQMYAISKKHLKELEKEYRKSKQKKSKGSDKNERVLDFTRRLMTVPIDKWSDPNR